MNVAALIPAYNEASRIAATVRAVLGIPQIDHVMVIDDGSGDDTALVAEQAGAHVLRLSRNVGKGAALDAGLADARERIAPDVVVLLDADLRETAAQADLLLERVLAGEADMTIARFPRPIGKAGFGLVKGLARWGIDTLGKTNFDAQAPLSGQRALSSAALDACTPFAGGYGVEVALTVRALRAGLRVVEIETTMAHAASGRDLSGFAHRGKQFIHVARALLSLAFEKPARATAPESRD